MMQSVLSRLARFLLRIARMLDRNLVGERIVVIPEHLAALRSRYPGAPKHWLEAVARRVNLAEPEAVSRPADAGYDPFHSQSDPIAHSQKSAPAVPFGRSRSRAAAEFGVTIRNDGRPTFDRHDRPARKSPPIAFARSESGCLPAESEPARPPASHRQEPQWIRFGEAERRSPQPQVETSSVGSRQLEFPHSEARQCVDHSEPLSPREPRPAWPIDTFTERDSRSSPRRERFTAGVQDRARTKPEFPEPPNPWPMLPALLVDEATSAFLDHDEAALFNEQVVGTWSA